MVTSSLWISTNQILQKSQYFVCSASRDGRKRCAKGENPTDNAPNDHPPFPSRSPLLHYSISTTTYSHHQTQWRRFPTSQNRRKVKLYSYYIVFFQKALEMGVARIQEAINVAPLTDHIVKSVRLSDKRSNIRNIHCQFRKIYWNVFRLNQEATISDLREWWKEYKFNSR